MAFIRLLRGYHMLQERLNNVVHVTLGSLIVTQVKNKITYHLIN